MNEKKLNIDIHIEQEFWGDFVQEAYEHLDDIESNVITLEQSPENMEIIHTMFRAFHTIKGLSGFVEHSIIQEIAHKTETMMDLCRKEELAVTTEVVNAILKSADYIKRLCEEVDSFNDSSFVDTIESHLVILESIAVTVDKKGDNIQTVTPVVPDSEIQEQQNNESSDNYDGASSEDICQESETTCENDVSSNTENIVIDDNFFNLEALNQNVGDEHGENHAGSDNCQEEFCNHIDNTFNENEQFISSVNADVSDNSEFLKVKEVENEIESEQKRLARVSFNKIFNNDKGANNFELGESIHSAKSSNEEYMKVANSKIDHLVDMIGELIISQSLLEQHIASNYSADNQLQSEVGGFLAITRELQSLSMSLRLVALKPTFNKITRIARDTIQELSKDVEFITSGETTEIDRAVAEKLLDPLVHLIKNAISHGVEETPQDRINAGKSPKAKVELKAYSKRGKIYIEVKDDGRGIDTDIVYQKALEKGIIDPGRTYSAEEIKEFILLPGFSTAKKVDNISGRGVGMDVVKTQIIRIGGKVGIESELGKGSVFTLEVPVNHAIMNGTIIDIEGQHFIVATVNVKEIIQPKPEQWIFTQGRATMLKIREDIIPIIPPSLLLSSASVADSKLVIVLELDQQLRALPITNVINRQEVVVKPVGLEFSNLQYISGMSILGNGQVSLILDIDYLFKKEVNE